jgi:hypothetical protein
MVVERWRKNLDGRFGLQVEKGWPSRERSALAEAPHESRLRVALDAARSDAVVIGCGAIAIEPQMDPIRRDRGMSVHERRRCP